MIARKEEEPASLISRYGPGVKQLGDTLCPDNGGVSVLTYLPILA